ESRNRIAQQDANTNLVTYSYDALNRVTNTLQHFTAGTLSAGGNRSGGPAGGSGLSWSMGYDPNGNPTNVVDARGQVAQMQYDHLNRLVRRVYSHHVETNVAGFPADFQPLEFIYQYDGNGNPT